MAISDDFNRANGAAGSGWENVVRSWNVVSNKLQPSLATGYVEAVVRRSESFDGDVQYAEADVVIGGVAYASEAGPGARVTISGNGYTIAKTGDGNTYLIKRNPGRNVLAADASDNGPGFENGDTVRLRVETNGTTIKGFVGPAGGPVVERMSVTDSEITGADGGKPGLFGQTSGTSYDSFAPSFDNFTCSAASGGGPVIDPMSRTIPGSGKDPLRSL